MRSLSIEWTLGILFENAREKHNNKIWVCLAHLVMVYYLYLKQETHFILYLSLFCNDYERVVANEILYPATNSVLCLSFFYDGDVTMGSNWNLRVVLHPSPIWNRGVTKKSRICLKINTINQFYCQDKLNTKVNGIQKE